MSVDGRAAEPAAAQRVGLIVALSLEHASLRRQTLRAASAGGWIIEQSGPGAARAARAASAALAAGARGLVSWGLAGGLDAELAPGAVVLPRVVRSSDGECFTTEPAWRGRLEAALRPEFALADGDLLSVPGVLETPAAKRAAAGGAVAADMESAAIGAAASAAGVPFVAIRVVVDALGDTLPPRAEQWVDAHGNQRLGPALGAVFQPWHWQALLTLARRYRVARAVLVRLAAALASKQLLSIPNSASSAG